MELIREIYDIDIDKNSERIADKFYEIRKASRAVIFNENEKIALLFVSKKHYHKLPGGGVEENESLTGTLIREVLEEVGCKISIEKELGVIVECKNKHEKIQFSYCYICKQVGDLENTSYTENEMSQGFELLWVKIDEAIKILENDIPLDYAGKFIRERDLTFLRYLRDKELK